MKTYSLTPQQFDALRTKLLSQGITIPSGTDGGFSIPTPLGEVEAKYHYDGSKLTLTILKKPVFLSASRIWQSVDQWVLG